MSSKPTSSAFSKRAGEFGLVHRKRYDARSRRAQWIKTAMPGKELTSLDHGLRVGNSIVADPAIDPKAFDWKAEFPEVFDREAGSGGFDVVIGNPPYIRQEWLSPIKPYLKSRY